MRFSLLLLSAIVSTLLPFNQSTAQWSNDPYENTLVSYQVFEPQMVSDGAGGAIIVYFSSIDDKVHAQRLDKFGYSRWGDNGIEVGGLGLWHGMYSGICRDLNGDLIVAFQDCYTASPTFYAKIFAQKIDTSGTRLWGLSGIAVCDLDSNRAYDPHIASDGAGGAFVIWPDRRNSLFQPHLYGQHLNAEGYVSWELNGIDISGETNAGGINSGIISGGSGYAMAFWHESSISLWGQRLDTAGNSYWGQDGILISNVLDLANQYHYDNVGGAIISAFYGHGGGGDQLISNRIDSSGSVLWGGEGTLIGDSIISSKWSTTINDSGVFYTWSSGSVGSFKIRIQRADYDGNLLWEPEGIIISNPASSSGYANNTSTGSSEVINIWHELTGSSLIAQKFNANAELQWIGGNITFSYNTNMYSNLRIINDMNGGAIMCWNMYPAILYAQQISANGNLGEVLSVDEKYPASIPTKITLLQNYPNPFNEATVIPIYIPQLQINNLPQIRIYNILGQTVHQYEASTIHPGMNYLHWGGSNYERIPVSTGWYILEIRGPGYRETIPMIKLR